MPIDELTQLDNRHTFFNILGEKISEANRYGFNVALVLIDIDRYQRINAHFGFEVGDRLLVKFAELLKSVKRDQDKVARIGDNTFAMLLVGILNAGHAELAAHKILRLLEVPFNYNNQKINLECSIAISICPMHGRDARHLMTEAESVLHETKKNSNKIGLSRSHEDEELSEYWDIEMSISQALKNDELSVYYQPKIDIQARRVKGAEALLRWKHPQRGFIAPGVFIPIAEQTGHIKPITAWVLNTALRQASRWTEHWGPQTVSVNIPPEFLLMPDFYDMVTNSLNLWGSENISLTLEIIERSFISQVERTMHALQKLQALGVKISIDDFGTGYSSLAYFEKLPVDEIKIDQSFVFNLLRSKASRDIVKLIRELGRAFDLEVVAEGVEDAMVLQYLQKIGCNTVQGFYYSKPLPDDKYQPWLSQFRFPDGAG